VQTLVEIDLLPQYARLLVQKKPLFSYQLCTQCYLHWVKQQEVARMNEISFSQAVEGFLLDAQNTQLASRMIADPILRFVRGEIKDARGTGRCRGRERRTI
jgi:hypothetical protein